MPLEIEDFLTDHRFIVLIDIREYSELSDEQQFKIIQLVTRESQVLINNGGYQKEQIFSSFIPTGDGFYLVGDQYLSLFWSQMSLVFAVSLRNALLKSFKLLDFTCKGVRISVHFGTTMTFTDIAGHTNFVGAGMNETARLLSPINKGDISTVSQKFYGHENIVIISQAALDKIDKLPNVGLRISDSFTVQAKHNKSFPCHFIDMPSDKIYEVLSLT